MIQLNRKLEYGVMALKHLYQKAPGELSTAKEICESQGAPFDAMSRILQTFTHAGWLRSEQGIHGGYALIRDLGKLSFYQLVEVIMGSASILKCSTQSINDSQSREERCQIAKTCNILPSLEYLNRRLAEFYKAMTLKELLDGRSPPLPGQLTHQMDPNVTKSWQQSVANLEGTHS